ncbi:MAG: hypothetical protein E7513_00550 [Ruminococcaceae bacterium]|nr:hypothetical protein [Oscillospiraceae bacterium]
MAKKIIIPILSVLIVAGAATGVYFYSQSNTDIDEKVTETPAVEEDFDGFMDEDLDEEDYIFDDVDTVEEDKKDDLDEFVPSDDSLSDNTDEVTSTNFSIEKIVDHTNGEQVQPRVVFGSGFNINDNYIRFDTDYNFELYISGYLNSTTKGTYTQYDDVIYVEYEDGTSAEYDVTYTTEGVISHIVVNYGDYDIYFS